MNLLDDLIRKSKYDANISLNMNLGERYTYYSEIVKHLEELKALRKWKADVIRKYGRKGGKNG